MFLKIGEGLAEFFLGKLIFDVLRKYRCPRCNYPVGRCDDGCPHCGQPFSWPKEKKRGGKLVDCC